MILNIPHIIPTGLYTTRLMILCQHIIPTRLIIKHDFIYTNTLYQQDYTNRTHIVQHDIISQDWSYYTNRWLYILTNILYQQDCPFFPKDLSYMLYNMIVHILPTGLVLYNIKISYHKADHITCYMYTNMVIHIIDCRTGHLNLYVPYMIHWYYYTI